MTAPTPVVADTHAFIWYVDADRRLSTAARQAFDDATGANLPIYVPTICLLEMHYLAAKGKVPGDTPQRLGALLQQPASAFEAHPLDTDVVVAAMQAPWKLGDPADRIIAGAARVLDVPLVTRDNRIIESGYVQTVW